MDASDRSRSQSRCPPTLVVGAAGRNEDVSTASKSEFGPARFHASFISTSSKSSPCPVSTGREQLQRRSNAMRAPVLVLDNGASTIKTSVVTGEGVYEPRCVAMNARMFFMCSVNILSIIPNAVVRSKADKRWYFGHELAECRDYSSLHYRLPFERVRG